MRVEPAAVAKVFDEVIEHSWHGRPARVFRAEHGRAGSYFQPSTKLEYKKQGLLPQIAGNDQAVLDDAEVAEDLIRGLAIGGIHVPLDQLAGLKVVTAESVSHLRVS